MKREISGLLFVVVLLAQVSGAQQTPPPQIVDLTAADGIKLKATYYPAGKPGPGVLLLHQCNRQRKVWDDLAGRLASAGINVLTLDLRGFGESGGVPNDKLTPQQMPAERQKWPSDIDVAFQYLKSLPGVNANTLGAGGASCGVNNSVQTARRYREVKSLVLLSGDTDLNGRQFLRKAEKLPVLFAVADDDEFPPTVQAIEWLYSISPNPGKKFLHYAKGGHGTDMFAVHPELPGAIVDWYVSTLLKTPGSAPVATDAPRIPDSVAVLDMIDQPGGAAKVAERLAAARRSDSKATLFPEAIVNILGYEHLQAGETKDAIEIMKLNAMAYPDSANVYDSLADAYLADGQKELARQNASKALELLASDTVDPPARRDGIRASAQQKLKQLDDGQR
jgi:dienelactone hydrolase